MKKKIVFLCLSLLLIVGMMSAGNAYAWFQDKAGSTTANSVRTGKIDYSIGMSSFLVASTDGVIYPEENLLSSTLSLANASDIATRVRVKIAFTYGGETITYDPTDTASPLAVTFASGWQYTENGYFCYSSSVDPKADVPVLTKICYSGPNTENDVIAGQDVQVTLFMEVKQSDYMAANDWNVSGT